jgi:hypothetical protein
MKGVKLNELPERYQRQVVAQIGVSSAVADMESASGYAPLAKKAPARFDGPVVIRVVEKRHRLPDRDGSSFKYLLDAIVSAGVLSDDNRKIVKDIKRIEVQITKDEAEETIVEIYEDIHSKICV